MMTRKQAYTVVEAAKRLGISKQAVRAAIKVGRLRARSGVVRKHVVLIPVAALDAFSVSQSHQARGKKS
jgi:excisionase family DNA binding protein